MNAHTPGPWHIDPEWIYPVEHPNWAAIKLGQSGATISGHVGKANAHLIAAAPDLLEALKELLASQLEIMPPFEAGMDAQNAWSDRRAKARNDAAAVIAKAEGQS